MFSALVFAAVLGAANAQNTGLTTGNASTTTTTTGDGGGDSSSGILFGMAWMQLALIGLAVVVCGAIVICCLVCLCVAAAGGGGGKGGRALSPAPTTSERASRSRGGTGRRGRRKDGSWDEDDVPTAGTTGETFGSVRLRKKEESASHVSISITSSSEERIPQSSSDEKEFESDTSSMGDVYTPPVASKRPRTPLDRSASLSSTSLDFGVQEPPPAYDFDSAATGSGENSESRTATTMTSSSDY